MKTLHLTLKKEYFDQILKGEKKEEFREHKFYWYNRLIEDDKLTVKKFDKIIFKNGYSKTAPTIEIEHIETTKRENIQTPLGKGNFFVIKLGKILKTENIKRG